MALWHCPFCGTPQAMSARCWVCHRSSTTCSTCRHFRTSLAADLGYCAKDRTRAPLTGLELRACWEEGARRAAEPMPSASPSASPAASPATRAADPRDGRLMVARGRGGPLDRPDPMRLRGFVPVDELLEQQPPPSEAAPVVPPALLVDPSEPWETRTSLFGDAEP